MRENGEIPLIYFFKFGGNRSRRNICVYIVGLGENGTLTYAKNEYICWSLGYQYKT